MEGNMQKSGIVQALDFVSSMLDVDEEISASTMAVFLAVCLQEGLSNSDVEEMLELPKARVSRNIQLLTKVAKRRLDSNGCNLVEMKIDPKDYRRRNLYLTNKGKSVRDKITKLLG